MVLPLVSNISEKLCVLVFFIISVLILKYHWNRRKLYLFSWKTRGPFAWPLIGNALKFTGNTVDITTNIQQLYEDYSTSVRIWFGLSLFYLVQSPEELAIILNSPKCLKKEQSYDFIRILTGDGLFSASVDKWKIHRKALMPTFNQKIMDSYVKIFQEHADILVVKLENYVGKGEFDFFVPINLYTLDIICETAMGIQMEEQQHGARFLICLDRLKEIVFERIFRIWYRIDIIFNRTSLAKEMHCLIQEVFDFTNTVMQNKRVEMKNRREIKKCQVEADELDNDNLRRKSFLELVLELTDEGVKFSDQDCIDEVVTFLIGGSDTTATVNSFTALALGMHPHIQEQVFVELDDIFGNSDRPITCEDLPKLKCLDRVLKETMRIFPVGIVAARECTQDVDLKTITIPVGVSLLVGILNLHRDPKLWPEPLKFDPDRFLPEAVAKRHPYAYLPFSAGPRNCVGIRFAMTSMKVTMATILRKYKFKSHFKKVDDIKLGLNIITRPIDGYMVEIELRK